MLEILTFIMSGFWIFVGCLMLISAVCHGFAAVLRAVAQCIHGNINEDYHE